jgi:hypothetical protein
VRFMVVVSLRGKGCEDVVGDVTVSLEDSKRLVGWLSESMYHNNVFFPVENDTVRRHFQTSFRSAYVES